VAEDCVLCGNCFAICPQQAKGVRDDIGAVKTLIESGAPVYASIAPSFTANYEGRGIGSMENILKKLGFAGAEETAIGATIVKRQYDTMLKNETQSVIISSCCHSVNLLTQKYYPQALPFLAPVLSPMLAHGMDIKRRHPGARTVFIGPCISKKDETETYAGPVDKALTFRELSRWLEEENIGLDESVQSEVGARIPQNDEIPERGLARLFPIPGGILRSMVKENPRYAYLFVDGIDNCIRSIEDLIRQNLSSSAQGPEKCFIEMSACTGSCLGGPAMPASMPVQNERHSAYLSGAAVYGSSAPVRDYIAVLRYAGKNDFETASYSAKELDKKFVSLAPRRIHLGAGAMEEVLRKLGKTRPEHELNCGSCGYNTCRDKARAVLEGKATLTMCLPYLKERAESFSDTIITHTPNGIIVLNETLEVQQINAAACRLFNISPQNILGDQVVRILDPVPFIEACRQEKSSYNRRVYLADYEKYIDETIIYDKMYRIIIGIMRDLTEETARKSVREEFNRKTIEITRKVIEKQMRTVQEIASLLGETTAETKVALTKLKESLSNE
jgi:PAS domain-containing protein